MLKKDGAGDILKDFSQKEKHINFVLNKTNEGLSITRNKTLKLVKSRYITFLEGDDIYDTTLFEKAVSLAEKEQSDLVL